MSNDKGEQAQQITLLQENLRTIRNIAGWTLDEFSKKIGVTKQTISNIENMKVKMNLTQYLAIRTVLDYEVSQRPKDDILSKSIFLLLDSKQELSEKDYLETKKNIEAIAAASLGGAEISMLPSLFCSVVPGAAMGILGAVGIVSGSWLMKLFQSKSNNKQAIKEKQNEQ